MAYCPAIGIDLGTTYCCVAVCKDGKAISIANEQGHRTTASYAWFSEDDIYTGGEAKKNSDKHPKQIVYGVKRLMGRKFHDPDVQEDISNWPFQVITENNVPKVQVEFKKEDKKFSAEQISAMFLEKMKNTAEAYMEQKVTEAVITVPAYFNDAQRTATIAAGRIAGLKVLRIINEPTAAALAYENEKTLGMKQTILVFDFGGGTLDVSILTNDNGKFKVEAVDGDNHLGGEDIDQNLLQYVVEECERKHNIVLNTNERAKLKSKCEKAKLSLSTRETAGITLDVLANGNSFSTTITRARFDIINADLFIKAMTLVQSALAKADKTPEDIDIVLLVGGSTRIPKITQLLQEIFKENKLSHGINPDEAVACGAAVQAAMLMNDQSNEIRKLTISDVIPLSLGVDIKGDMMSKIITRSSKIPITNSQTFVTTEDNQTCIHFRVLEGERLMAADNNHLGHFVLNGLPPAPRGTIQACVTFKVDSNGVLTVSAVEEKTGSRAEYTVTSDRQQITDEEINRMIKEAEQFKIDDENRKQCASLKNELEDYIFKIQKALEGTLKTNISNSDKITVSLQCINTSKWLAQNPKVQLMELRNQKKLLENLWDPILKKTSTK